MSHAACRLAASSGLWKATDSRFNEYVVVIAFTGTPTGGRRVVVAYHALNDTFPIGTLRAMIADAGWGDDDLLRFGPIE